MYLKVSLKYNCKCNKISFEKIRGFIVYYFEENQCLLIFSSLTCSTVKNHTQDLNSGYNGSDSSRTM